jgi:hypothetical protein
MMPPELLHTSGCGLIMYMFESLYLHLGGGIDQDYIDQEQLVVSNIIQRESECDFHVERCVMVSLKAQKCNRPNGKETYFDFCA